MGLWGTLGGLAGGVGGFFLGGPAGAAAGFGIGSSIGSGADSQSKANDYQQQALQQAQQQYADRAPFRQAALGLLSKQVNPDAVTAIYANNANPFARNNKYVDPMAPSPAPPAGSLPSTTAPTAAPSGPPSGAMPSSGTMQDMASRRAQLSAIASLLPRRQQVAQ